MSTNDKAAQARWLRMRIMDMAKHLHKDGQGLDPEDIKICEQAYNVIIQNLFAGGRTPTLNEVNVKWAAQEAIDNPTTLTNYMNFETRQQFNELMSYIAENGFPDASEDDDFNELMRDIAENGFPDERKKGGKRKRRVKKNSKKSRKSRKSRKTGASPSAKPTPTSLRRVPHLK